jgi:hypothetical protein
MANRSITLALVVVLSVVMTAAASNNAWMYGNQPSTTDYVPDPTHSFNPVAPGTIKVHRFTQGGYQITFKNLVTVTGNNANVQVTAYGNGNANCRIQGWGTVPGPDFNAFVRCYVTTTGQSVDSEYSLLVTFH